MTHENSTDSALTEPSGSSIPETIYVIHNGTSSYTSRVDDYHLKHCGGTKYHRHDTVVPKRTAESLYKDLNNMGKAYHQLLVKYEALNNEYVDLKSKYEALGRSHDRLVADMQWFCDRVDKGEVRSKNTYNRFKQALTEAEKVSE